jgi:hypothetical protein
MSWLGYYIHLQTFIGGSRNYTNCAQTLQTCLLFRKQQGLQRYIAESSLWSENRAGENILGTDL